MLGFDQYLLGKVWSPYLYNIFQILNHKTCEFTQTLWNHTKALYIIEMERNINWRTPSGGLENKRMRLRIYLKIGGMGCCKVIHHFLQFYTENKAFMYFTKRGCGTMVAHQSDKLTIWVRFPAALYSFFPFLYNYILVNK